MKNTDTMLYKKTILLLLIFSVGSALLFAFALSPLIAYANSEGTIPYLSDVFSVIYWIFDLIVFFVCYALTDFCIYRFKLSKALIAVLIFSLSTVAKYALNTVSSFYIFSSLPTSNQDFKDQIMAVVINVSAELVQYLLVSLVAVLIIRKHNKLAEIAQKGAAKLGVEYDKRALFFPFKKLFSVKNPLQLTALLTAIIVAFIKIIPNRLFYDILFGGLPTGIIDGIWMFVSYSTDILFCLLGYFVMIYVFSKSDTTDLTLKITHKEK